MRRERFPGRGKRSTLGDSTFHDLLAARRELNLRSREPRKRVALTADGTAQEK